VGTTRENNSMSVAKIIQSLRLDIKKIWHGVHGHRLPSSKEKELEIGPTKIAAYNALAMLGIGQQANMNQEIVYHCSCGMEVFPNDRHNESTNVGDLKLYSTLVPNNGRLFTCIRSSSCLFKSMIFYNWMILVLLGIIWSL